MPAAFFRIGSAPRLALALAASLIVSSGASATNWYVDGLHGKSGNTGSSTSPFQQFFQAGSVAQPGDTIYLLPTIVYPNITISFPGTAGHPITVTGAGRAPNLTKVRGTTTKFAVQVSANYITVSNLDLMSPGTQSGMQIVNVHHITVANNVIHDSGGNGISTVGDDYLTISHNILYGNSWNTTLDVYGSAISVKQNTDIDSNTGLKTIVDGNVIYNNTNLPGCTPQPSCLSTDTDLNGNGVLIDDNRHTQTDNNAYKGATLISNNVIFGNGGRGIQVFASDNTTVEDNTCAYNNQDPYESINRPGEVHVNGSGNVLVANNILYSDGATGQYTGAAVPLSFQGGTINTGPLIGRYNIGFNAQSSQTFFYGNGNTIPVTVSNNIIGDPKFENLSLNPATADYRLKPTSPALRTGYAPYSAATDILGVRRTLPAAMGAYQRQGP